MSTATTNSSSSSSASKSKSVGKVAEASPAMHSSAAASVSDSNGKRMYRMSTGQMVELPTDMSMEDAAKLESEANAAQKKLKGPSPKVIPDIKEKAKLKDKKESKAKPKGKKGAGGKQGGGKSKGSGKNDSKAAKAIKGKVGAWLMAKGAPAISRGQSKLNQLKTNEQTHDDAASKLAQTEKAVVPPTIEGQSTSNAGQVDNVEGKPVPQPNEALPKQQLNTAIADNIPQSIEDVDNFKKNNKAGAMSASVAIVVNKDKNEVSGTFGDLKQTPAPTPSEVKPEVLPPEEVAPATAKMNLGADTIAPLQKEHTDVSNYTKEADSKLKEEGVTQEQLDMVDTGDLAEANKEKKGMDKKAKTEPLAVTQFAQQANKKVDADLQQEENKGRDEIKNKRKQKLTATKQKQQGTKSEIEKKREDVANKINGIYKRAQDKVTKKLADLETVAIKRFDDGNAKATKEFEDTVKRELDAFKDDRYSGFWGWARKAKDWVLGMEDLPRVKAIFDNNRTIFVNTVNALVDAITADNKKVVQECKDELGAARTEIKDFVDKLGPELKDAGKKAQDDMNSQLDELDKTINKKEEELQNKLKDKQAAAIKAIDEKIEKMKEAMSGALSKLGKLLLLAAKKFFSWALEKFGFSLAEIDSIINKGAAVLKAIFTQPIQFVKNLMNAAITGFQNFGKNFLKHLKDALFEWLTGSLEGLTLPKVWDFKGIISIGLQMIGISYANIRRHMVTVMGETVVGGLEKTFTLVKTLITEGPMAAWEQLKEMAGEMRDAFIDAVKDFIKTKIIEQAIQWIVGLFVPGAGIIKAIVGIYDTIVFFINKAKQIMQMISNFLGSIGSIAAGNIGAAADAMENGLARGLSLVINFLAQLLHMNGVTDKIRNAIQKIKDKVDGVLLKVAKWIAEKAKSIFGAIKSGVQGVLSWAFRKTFQTKDGQTHSLFFETHGTTTKLMVASEQQHIEKFFADKRADLLKSGTPEPAKIKAIDDAKALYDKDINPRRDKVDSLQQQKVTPERDAEIKKVQKDLEPFLSTLSNHLVIAGVGTNDTEVVQTKVEYNKVGGSPKSVTADPLTKHGDAGSRPGADPPGWKSHIETIPEYENYYVRLHLLSDGLHGKGVLQNLVPGKKSENRDMEGQAETPAMRIIEGGHVLWYESSVTNWRSIPTGDFPEKIKIEYGFKEKVDASNWKRRASSFSKDFTISEPDPIGTRDPIPTVDTMSSEWLNRNAKKEKANIPWQAMYNILKARNKRDGKKYLSMATFWASPEVIAEGPAFKAKLEAAIAAGHVKEIP